MKIIVTAMIISVFTACSFVQDKKPISSANSGTAIPKSETVIDESNQLAHNKNSSDEFLKFKKFWNLEVLGNFKEPSLEKSAKKIEESYRFIWIPSFDNPIAIRVWRSGKSQFIVVKKTNGQGFEMGTLSYEKTRNMTAEEWLKFTNLLNQISFWNMSPVDINYDPVTDGAYYEIEGSKNKQFHEVHRGTGSNEEAKVRELGTYLLSLSSLETKYTEY